MVAPILDEHCARCHNSSNHESGFDLRMADAPGPGRTWTTSYNSLLEGIGSSSSNSAINICYMFQQSEPEPPGSFGACKSGMMKNIENGHNDVTLSETEKKIIACWIDLGAPHGGDYSDYLTNPEEYGRLKEKRERWAEIEAENIREYIAFCETEALPDDHRKVPLAYSKRLGIKYLPTLRELVLSKTFQGDFMLVDLRGRVIFRMKLPDTGSDGDISVSLPSCLSTGYYLANFKSVDGIRRTDVVIINK